jgi:hypothetical protein
MGPSCGGLHPGEVSNVRLRRALEEGKHEVSATAGPKRHATKGPKLGFISGFSSGQVIQELGYDDDVDAGLREAIETATGSELVDEDFGDVTDGAIMWWRDDDGDVSDLTDALVDAQSSLDNGGLVWVLTPKSGRSGHVEPGDVEEAARTAGLHATSAVAAAPNWSGIRLAARARGR